MSLKAITALSYCWNPYFPVIGLRGREKHTGDCPENAAWAHSHPNFWWKNLLSLMIRRSLKGRVEAIIAPAIYLLEC